jgi:uncharacterized membrane protein YqaE (UPF0057 family)
MVDNEFIGQVILMIAAILIYFLPYIIGRKTTGANGILVLNLFLGWTFLGWIAALIWAVQSPVRSEHINY